MKNLIFNALKRWLFGEYGVFWSTDALSWAQSQKITRLELKRTIEFLDHYYRNYEVPAFCEIVDMRTGEMLRFWQRDRRTFGLGDFTLLPGPCQNV